MKMIKNYQNIWMIFWSVCYRKICFLLNKRKNKMTYWHMQLHPDDKNWRREKELLEKKSLIGLGEWEGGQSQINQFKNEMQIGDIVLIKRGALAIALTKVIGSFEE